MRHIRIVGLCLTMALLLGAVVSVGARASTEFVSCVKTEKVGKFFKGHYDNGTCTEKASEEEVNKGGNRNKYELDVGAKWSAKNARRTEMKLDLGGGEVVCLKSAGSGTWLSSTRVSATFRFGKCEGSEFESLCTSPGDKAGEIETKPLLGVLGENASREVFVLFTGEEVGSIEPAPAETFAEFECGGIASFTLHGTLSGRWTEAVNTSTKTGGIVFAPDVGEQDLVAVFPNAMSGEAEEGPATLESEQSLKFKYKYELRHS